MSGYNQAIARFLKEDISIYIKQQIILNSIYYKYALLFVFVTIIFIVMNNSLLEFIVSDYSEVRDRIDDYILISIAFCFVSITIGLSSVILFSLYHYSFVANLNILRNLVYLFMVIGLIFVTDNYIYYLYVSWALSVVTMSILIWKIGSDYKEYSIFEVMKNKLDIKVYREYLYPYAIPLTGSSLMMYAKQHLPILVLGKEFELNTIASYSIMKNIVKAMHGVTGSFMEKLISKLIEKRNDKVKFKKIINTIFYGMITTRLMLYFSLILFMDIIFSIYKIDDDDVNQLIVYILGAEFVVAGLMVVYGVLLQLEKNTKYIFYISLSRFIFELTLIFLILMEYGVLAAALIFLLSRYLETLIASFVVAKDGVVEYSRATVLFFLPVMVYFSWAVIR